MGLAAVVVPIRRMGVEFEERQLNRTSTVAQYVLIKGAHWLPKLTQAAIPCASLVWVAHLLIPHSPEALGLVSLAAAIAYGSAKVARATTQR